MAATADADAGPVALPGPGDPGGRRLGWVGLGVAAFCFLVGVLAASILGATWAASRGFLGDDARLEADFGFFVISAVGLWVGFLGLPLLWSWTLGGPGPVLGMKARWTDLPLGLVAGLGSTLVTGVISGMLLSSDELGALERKARETVDRASGPAAVVLLVFVICIATPIAEEVFFRGLVFRSLRGVAGLVVALPVAGLVFGLVHYDREPVAALVVAVQLGLLGLFGVVLCALAHWTGRLAASIVAHAAFNSVTVLTLLLSR
ncbi:MAG: CPBP family intramembrane glutamic endopeptidase [Acidimicrobiales bacterium]